MLEGRQEVIRWKWSEQVEEKTGSEVAALVYSRCYPAVEKVFLEQGRNWWRQDKENNKRTKVGLITTVEGRLWPGCRWSVHTGVWWGEWWIGACSWGVGTQKSTHLARSMAAGKFKKDSSSIPHHDRFLVQHPLCGHFHPAATCTTMHIFPYWLEVARGLPTGL